MSNRWMLLEKSIESGGGKRTWRAAALLERLSVRRGDINGLNARIGQNTILKELHFVHDVRDSSEDFERSLDNGVGIEPGMFG
jgi:hypothetical protein